MMLEMEERYNADEALSHPWLTRRFEDKIPVRMSEINEIYKTGMLLKRCIRLVCFIGTIRANKNCVVTRKKSIDFVSKDVDVDSSRKIETSGPNAKRYGLGVTSVTSNPKRTQFKYSKGKFGTQNLDEISASGKKSNLKKSLNNSSHTFGNLEKENPNGGPRADRKDIKLTLKPRINNQFSHQVIRPASKAVGQKPWNRVTIDDDDNNPNEIFKKEDIEYISGGPKRQNFRGKAKDFGGQDPTGAEMEKYNVHRKSRTSVAGSTTNGSIKTNKASLSTNITLENSKKGNIGAIGMLNGGAEARTRENSNSNQKPHGNAWKFGYGIRKPPMSAAGNKLCPRGSATGGRPDDDDATTMAGDRKQPAMYKKSDN